MFEIVFKEVENHSLRPGDLIGREDFVCRRRTTDALINALTDLLSSKLMGEFKLTA